MLKCSLCSQNLAIINDNEAYNSKYTKLLLTLKNTIKKLSIPIFLLFKNWLFLTKKRESNVVIQAHYLSFYLIASHDDFALRGSPGKGPRNNSPWLLMIRFYLYYLFWYYTHVRCQRPSFLFFLWDHKNKIPYRHRAYWK